jgi:hypothetical protein
MRHLKTSSLRVAVKCLAASRRDRSAAASEQRAQSQLRDLEEFAAFGNLPLQARIADRLADAMWAIDEAVQMCELEGDATRDASRLAPQILAAYDQVNWIMKTITN